MVAADENIGIVDALIKVYNSFISAKIDDYNSSVYYENPSYIFESYRENRMLAYLETKIKSVIKDSLITVVDKYNYKIKR